MPAQSAIPVMGSRFRGNDGLYGDDGVCGDDGLYGNDDWHQTPIDLNSL